MRMWSDGALTKALKAGDMGAYEELFYRYYALIFRFVLRFIRNEALAEDVVQNIFMRLWLNRENLDENKSVKNFLYVSARNESFDILKSQKEKYVVMSDTNIAFNFNFKALLDAHIASEADVTIAYTKEELPESILTADDLNKGNYYTLDLDGDRVNKIHINPQETGVQNFSMNVYVFEREHLVKLVNEAFMAGGLYLERDILMPQLNELKVNAYEYTEYAARIGSLKGYFDESMKLLEDKNLEQLFGKNSIYTKIRDDNPTRYINGSSARNVMVADGCVVEGEIENCILFRGVKVGKGAKVKNAILMQDTVIEAGVNAEYIITDKKVKISEGKEIKGADTKPFFIRKKEVV